MKRNSIILILLLIIVSVFVMSCDDLFTSPSRMNQDDVDDIAWAAAKAFVHMQIYFEDPDDEFGVPFSVEGIGDEGLSVTHVEGIGDEGDRMVIAWDNFDVGDSIRALLDDDDVPENIKDDIEAFIDPGQLIIIDGSADAYTDAGEADVQMTLKIDDSAIGLLPIGTYSVIIEMKGMQFGPSGMLITIIVDGIKANFDVEDLR